MERVKSNLTKADLVKCGFSRIQVCPAIGEENATGKRECLVAAAQDENKELDPFIKFFLEDFGDEIECPKGLLSGVSGKEPRLKPWVSTILSRNFELELFCNKK